jgi:hypothetical protein
MTTMAEDVNPRALRERSLSAVVAMAMIAVLGFVGACGSKTDQQVLGGESHFLSDCGSGCENGLECIGGVCTKQCGERSDCAGLDSDAECTRAGELGDRVCDVACERDDDCSDIGDEHACAMGFCRSDGSGNDDDSEGDSDDAASDDDSSDDASNVNDDGSDSDDSDDSSSVVVVADDDKTVDDSATADSCEIDGEFYEYGESFPCGDGCNTCRCAEGGIQSTLIACVDAGAPDDVVDGCVQDGAFHEVGEIFACSDDCNTCRCDEDGVIVMTEMDCGAEPATECEYDGTTYLVGEDWTCRDGCNVCSCTEFGVTQTLEDCVPPSEEGCVVDGVFYEANAPVPCGNNCICYCNADGSIDDLAMNCDSQIDPQMTFNNWDECADDHECICSALEGCEAAGFFEALPLGSHSARTCSSAATECVVAAFEETEGYGVGYECHIPRGIEICNTQYTLDLIGDYCTRKYDCSLLMSDDCSLGAVSCDDLDRADSDPSDGGADGSGGGSNDGSCMEDCESSGLTCCDGECVNAGNDPFNCGACGTVCAAGTMCNAGSCSEAQCGECADGELCCLLMQGPWSLACSEPQNGTCPVGCPLCDCASPGTKIATPSGERDIAELKVGDVVYSIENESIVEATLSQVRQRPVANHEVMQIELESGRVLRISAPHPTADGRTFGALEPGQTLDGMGIVGARPIPYAHPFTYDILPNTSTGVYFAEGVAIGSTLHGPSMSGVAAATAR